MQLKFVIQALAAAGVLSGCTGNTLTLGPGKTFAEFEAEHDALETSVGTVFTDEGTTLFDDLPDTAGDDTASYEGTIHGEFGGGSGPDLEYYADMTMNANFDTNTVGGSLDNFVTDLAGFSAPDGSASLTGTISEDLPGGEAHIDFAASGLLEQTSTATSADFYTSNAFGHFGGTDPDVARGTHESNFEWLTGPNTGDTSWSDGDWYVTQ